MIKLKHGVHGPVFKELYIDYKHFNYEKTFASKSINNSEDVAFLEQVYEVYGKCNGYELESISHQELPWINARKGYSLTEACSNVINDKDIFTEYLQRLNGD